MKRIKILCILVVVIVVFSIKYNSVYAADVNLQMYNSNTSVATNSLALKFKITNSATTPINLTDVKLRYYYTVDGDKQQSFYCDQAGILTGSNNYMGITTNVTGTFVKMSTATDNADYYLEIGFNNTANTLDLGATAEIQARVAKSDWSNYNQTNDYSFNSSATQYVKSDKIVLLLDGNNVSGVPPTAPKLTAGAITRTSDTEATVKFTSDKTGEYYYEVVEDGASAPTIDTSGAGIACDITETTITNPTGLNAGAKDIYIVVKDASGDISIPIKLDIPAYVAPDTTSPTITSGSCAVAADNTYIDIVFSEGVYGAADGATALTAGKLALTFTQNGGTATNTVISSVKKTDGTALTGGESTVRVFLTVTGTPNGLETIEIKPANSTSIYDLTGNAILATQTSGEKSLMDLAAPIATVQAITGTLQAGATLTGHYTYSDVNSEGASTFKWYRADTAAVANKTPIAGATALTYVLQTADIGKYISFEVTPVAAVGTAQGTSVESALVGPIVAAGGGHSGSGSSSTIPVAPIITVAEVKNELFNDAGDVKVEADVSSAFGQSVAVKITDVTESQKEILLLTAPNDIAYPFDISLYSGTGGEKVQPKDGYSVKITLPVPKKLLEDKKKIKIVYSSDGKLETLKSQLIEKNGKWYITFEAVHFSPYALIVSAEPWINPFSDVKESDWYYSAVRFTAQNGLMVGTSSNTFSPGMPTDRGMIVTILYRLSCSTETLESTFRDVISSTYSAKAVAWAQKRGIVSGYGNGMFGPENNITREQMIAILWRYAGSPKADTTVLADFNDVGEISEYAKNALAWAHKEGIIADKGNRILDPKGMATRTEVAKVIESFVQKVDLMD